MIREKIISLAREREASSSQTNRIARIKCRAEAGLNGSNVNFGSVKDRRDKNLAYIAQLQNRLAEQATQIEKLISALNEALDGMGGSYALWSVRVQAALNTSPSQALEQFAAKVRSEAFEAVIENLNPKHFVTGAMYQSTIAAIREMAKEKQNAD